MNVFDLQGTIKLDTGDYDSKLSASEGKATGFASKLGAGLGTVGKVAGAAMAAAGTAIVRFGASSVKTGAEFDSAMSQVAATMGTTVDQIGNLRDYAQEMGATTAFSATQSAEALNYMALAGYDAETSMKMLPNVLNLAASGGMELAAASDMVTDAQSALGLTIEETTTMVDQMAKTASTTNTSVEQLGSAFLTVGGTARNLKGGTAELSQALGILADNGIKGAEGGTKLRNMILSLSAPTEKAAGVLDQLGVSAFDADGEMRPLQDTFMDLNAAMADMTTEEKTQALNTIFNKADLKAVNALLGTNADRWEEVAEKIGDCEGAAEAMANTQLDNLQGDVTLFKSAWEGLQIAISDKVTPALRDFVSIGSEGISEITKAIRAGDMEGAFDALGTMFEGLLEKITQLIPQIVELATRLLIEFAKALIQQIPNILKAVGTALTSSLKAMFQESFLAGAGAVAGLVGILFNPLVKGVRTAIKAFSAIKNAFQIFTGVLGYFNPVVLAVVAGIAAVVLAVTHWGEITDFVKGLWESFTSWFSGIWETITAPIVSAWDTVVTAVQTAWDTVTNVIQVAVMFIQEIINLFAGIFQGIWSQIWNYIGEPVTTAFNAVSTFISGVLSAIGNAISTAWNAISSTTSSIFSSIANFISTIWNNIRNTVSTIAQAVVTAVQGAWSALSGIASSIWNSVVSAVQTAFSPVQQKVATIVDTVKNKLETAWGTVSGTVSGIFEGIKNAMTKPVEAARDKIKSAIDKIKGFFNITLQGPNIKLPVITTSGKFSLNPPSVPHFHLAWHKDAYDNPLLFTSPTVLGAHGFGDKAGGGGELVVGRNNLMNWITQAMAKGTTSFANVIASIGSKIVETIISAKDDLRDFLVELLTNSDVLIDMYRLTNDIQGSIYDEQGNIKSKELLSGVENMEDNISEAKNLVADMFNSMFDNEEEASEDISGEAVADAMEDIQEEVLPSMEELVTKISNEFTSFIARNTEQTQGIMSRQQESNAILKSIDSHLMSASSNMAFAMKANAKPSIGTVTININGGKDDAETIANKVNAIIMKQYQVKRAYA